MNIAFASDLHVAHLWDEISDAVNRYAPEFLESVTNPHRLLDRFIDETNALAANGKLDLIVLGGDLVDHVHRHARADKRNGASSNVHLLLDRLDRLEVPTLMVPGNHDHRSYPRRPQSSGLDVVGISRQQKRALLCKSRLWNRWPLAPGDLDSVRTMDASGVPALSDYLIEGTPATDYSVVLRGLRLLMVSSGCDILNRWRDVEYERLGLLMRGLYTARYHPDSEGFSEAQLARIGNWLDDCRGAALFFHAPLLAAGGDEPLRQRIGSLNPGPQDSLRRRVRFEKKLLQSGLRCGISFRNPGALLQKLAAAAGPVAAFSGHVHYASAIGMDHDTMQARSLDPGQAVSGSGTIALLTAPALGQLSPLISQPPGYLLAQFTGGALVSVLRRTLDVPRCP